MYPLPLRASTPLRQLRGAHSFVRPPNQSAGIQNAVQSPESQDSSFRKPEHRAKRQYNSSFEFWDHQPKFEEPKHLTEKHAEKSMELAQMKRWTGRRSMFLGDYRERRDAAFARQDDLGTDVTTLYQPSIYKLFGYEKDQTYLWYPCVEKLQYTQRQFTSEHPIDLDQTEVEGFVKAAITQLDGRTLDLKNPCPEVKFNSTKQVTRWPDQAQSRQRSFRMYSAIRKVLRRGDLVIIRATYQHLNRRYLDRSFMPGLLRLMIRSLASKSEWVLLRYLLVHAMRQTPSLSERDITALANYANSLSIKASKGRGDILDLNKYSQGSGANANYRGQRLSQPVLSKTSSSLFDDKIQMCAETQSLRSVLMVAEEMAKLRLVPRYKTINKILRKMISEADLSPTSKQRACLHTTPLLPLQQRTMPARTYSTAVVTSPQTSFATLPRSSPGKSSVWDALNDNNRFSNLLAYLLTFLNQHNIHHTTIRLVAKLVSSLSDIDLLWDLTRRTKHPKTMIRQVQAALVEAGCTTSFSTSVPRHLKLSAGLVEILRLEGMGIVPSKESIIIALRTSLKHGNISGARTLMSRIRGYHYSLENEDVVELVKILPCTGAGASSLTGVDFPPMQVRTEQLDFLLELRPYFTKASYLGPYVLALGRCGNTVEIWSVWNSLQVEKMKDGEKLKEGVVRSFVEAFVIARDLPSAITFIKVAYQAGYPLDSWRIEKIASILERGKSIVGRALMSEMVVQRVVMSVDQVERTVRSIFERQKELSSSDHQVISDVSATLTDLIATNGEGKDIQNALDEVDRILGIKGQDGERG